jgi:hypothetical protein
VFNWDHKNLKIIDSFNFDHSYNIVIIYKWQRVHGIESVCVESRPVESIPAESGPVESVLGEGAALVFLGAPEKHHVLVRELQVTF